MARSAVRVVVILLVSLRGIAGTALGIILLVSAANDDSGWGALIAFGGVICLALGVASLAQAAFVWSRRPRLQATAAIIEAGYLLLWLWLRGEGRGSSDLWAQLLLVASIVGLCSLAASMWRVGGCPCADRDRRRRHRRLRAGAVAPRRRLRQRPRPRVRQRGARGRRRHQPVAPCRA